MGMFTELRASATEESIGMDETYHGEEAYPSGEGAILVMTEPPRGRQEDAGVYEPAA
jgi:Amt family ammonium transporter